MVGRGDLLSGLLGLCQSGSGSTVVLTGVAGSGKSRLLSELGSLAEADGALVLRGHAVAGGGAFRPVAEALIRVAPVVLSADERLAPFRWVLARILPTWPAGTTGGVHLVDPVVVLGEAVLELLRVIGADRACVLLLDDLHWADQDTLALLEYLVGGVTSLGVTVVAAARDDEVQPPGLSALRHHAAVSTVSLPGLSRADVVELARMCAAGDLAPDVEDYLVGSADGLPLWVEELFAGLVEAGLVVREGTLWRAVGPIPPGFPERWPSWWAAGCTPCGSRTLASCVLRPCLGRTSIGRCFPRSPAATRMQWLRGCVPGQGPGCCWWIRSRGRCAGGMP